MRRKKSRNKEADLDITSFMNLMIILVPVLLLNMVFATTAVLELKLPDLASESVPNPNPKNDMLELLIFDNEMLVYYPSGNPMKRIGKIADPETGEQVYDYALLSEFLQQLKLSIKETGVDKKDIFILSQQNTEYKTIVKTMDTVRSYKAVIVASVVDAVLFPEISLGDAPINVPPATGGTK